MHAEETITLLAPLSGPIVPIDAVPDPVFAEKMVGDGISINPISQTLLAPCAATVAQVHAATHALSLVTAAGVEILIHIGLDTVTMKGEGFKARVKDGDKVTAGQPLIDFDADLVLRKGLHLLTQIVVTNGDAAVIVERASGMAKAGKSRLLTLKLLKRAADPRGASPKGGEASAVVVVPNPNGLHARPAAVLVNEAKTFAGEIRLELAGRRANAKSLVAVLSLGVGARAEVRVVATGADAAEAAKRLADRIRSGLGEDLSAAPAVEAPRPAARAPRAGDDDRHYHGVMASPGQAIGAPWKLDPLALEIPSRGADVSAELSRLSAAIAQSRLDLQKLIHSTEAGNDAERAEIFGAHLTMLEDPEMKERAEAAIREGASAALAFRDAVSWGEKALTALDNPLLAARASDLRDVGQRVLLRLIDGGEAPVAPAGSVVLAENLTPSDVIRLASQKVAGLVTVLGGTTSHAAILARSLGLPYLVGVSPSLLTRASSSGSSSAVIDAERSVLVLDPDAAERDAYRLKIEARRALRAANEATATAPAATRDGVHVEVLANIATAADARDAVRLGAEGVGLLRTELLFLERKTAPTEAEQTAAYEEIAAALGERPLIIRTLDIGGDKPLPYLPLPAEDNPLLGIRGLRLGWLEPEILRGQLRAILAARTEGRRRVMLPMVASLSELREVTQIFEEERRRLGAPKVELGIMIEVPSAAILADLFAAEVDFFSIGTNDLTQYTLAMDRTHPRLASRQDALHPAVLRLIDTTVQAGRKHGKPVGVCGALASDLDALTVLIGLGVTDLSVSVQAIPEIKARIRDLDAARCRDVARAALALGDAAEVRALLAPPTTTHASPNGGSRE